MNQIIAQQNLSSKHFLNQKTASTQNQPNYKELSWMAKLKKPLSRLQFMVFMIMCEDQHIQQYCNRSIREFAIMCGASDRGVEKALAYMLSVGFVTAKKQTRGRTTIRTVTRLGLAYSPKFFRRNNKNNKSAPQSAPQRALIPYKISYSESKNKKDLLKRDSIIRMTQKEEEAFRVFGFKVWDEMVILGAIKRSQLTPDERFCLARDILAAYYKKSIEHPRAYYLKALENRMA